MLVTLEQQSDECGLGAEIMYLMLLLEDIYESIIGRQKYATDLLHDEGHAPTNRIMRRVTKGPNTISKNFS